MSIINMKSLKKLKKSNISMVNLSWTFSNTQSTRVFNHVKEEGCLPPQITFDGKKNLNWWSNQNIVTWLGILFFYIWRYILFFFWLHNSIFRWNKLVSYCDAFVFFVFVYAVLSFSFVFFSFFVFAAVVVAFCVYISSFSSTFSSSFFLCVVYLACPSFFHGLDVF